METNVTSSSGAPSRITYTPKNTFKLPVPQVLSLPHLGTCVIRALRGQNTKSFTLEIGKVRPREGKGLTQGPTAACKQSWDQIPHLWTPVLPKTKP